MTETVTPENETTESVVPPLEQLGSEDDLAAIAVKRARAAHEKLTEVTGKLNASGNVGQLLSEALQNSEDSEVQELLRKVEKAQEAINSWTKAAEDKVKPTLKIPSEDETKALEDQYKTYVSQLKTFDTVFTNEVKADYPELSIYDYVGDIPKARKSGGTTGAKAGQGEGTSRPRVKEIAVSTDNGNSYSRVENKDGKSTFSTLVMWFKKETDESISASDLHEAWTEQNGGKDWNKLPEQTTFAYSLAGTNYFVRVTR
jgi:hypothetical protein